ncbi:MAG: Alpha/beta hydrolase [Hyphomicrobiales bacterium]|nr:Alpha/beta hydrolase [Hyphomicrobiales bacterium]
MSQTADHFPVESRYVSAPDGLLLHVREYGRRPDAATPVVCLPGLSRTCGDFDALARALAAGSAGAPRRVLALDYRGRGLSEYDSNWRNYDLKIENADILACLTALGVEHAVFVGTSRGGLHVMMLGATRPGVLRAAVLNDIGPVLEARGLARIRSYIGKLPMPASWTDAVDLLKNTMSGQFPDLTPAEWETYARLTFKTDKAGFALRYDSKLMRTLENIDLESPLPTAWPQFEGLKNTPLLALRGSLSDLLSPETLAQMQVLHPNFEAHVVERQGHAPLLLDAPTIARVSAFVAGH